MKKVLKKALAVLAYTWGVLCIIIVFITFVGGDTLARLSTRLPFMKVDPVYTGGAIVNTYTADSLLIQVHEPVFSALIGKAKTGFIQLEFHPDTLVTATLPRDFTQSIDYDLDGVSDFLVHVNTPSTEATLTACPSKCLSINTSARVKDYWVVRVALPNTACDNHCTTCPLNQ